MRNDQPEASVLINQLVDPPQGDEYLPLSGDLFPTEYPIDKGEQRWQLGYFFKKYYIT